MRGVCAIAALILGITGCTSQPEVANDCPGPRPVVCTREYAPTCALLKSGKRKEFASPCTACSDEETVGYDKGPCRGE